MALLHRALSALTLADLQQLVENGVSESRNLDYKQSLPNFQDGKDKREFLYDISAMANGGGGDIIYGVEEERVSGRPSGRPLKISGVSLTNPDSAVLMMENLIRDGVDPRILGREIRPLQIGEGQYVVLVRIPRSLTAPHMVTVEGGQRFYTRNSAGKHPMDVSELRGAFLATSGFLEQAKRWRMERLAQLRANEACIRLQTGAKVALHLIPLASTDPYNLLSTERLKEEAEHLLPLSSGGSRRINFEGFMMYASDSREADPYAYVEYFRTGQIESVDAGLLNNKQRYIPSLYLEEQLIRRTDGYLRALKNTGVQPPIVVALTLLEVRGYHMAVADQWNKWMVAQDDLVVPLVVIEDWTTRVDQLLRPMLDSIWNACGYSYSPNFDEDGLWKPKR